MRWPRRRFCEIISNVWNEVTIPSELCYHGRLLSGRRPMLLCTGLATAFLMTAAVHSTAATVAAFQALVAIVALRIFAPANFVWSESVRFSIDAAGLTLTRPSGKTHLAEWKMFDDVRLRPLHLLGEKAVGETVWKLTLMNARKPAISSFINADSDLVLFMFPLEFAFDATADEARELHDALAAMILQPAQ